MIQAWKCRTANGKPPVDVAFSKMNEPVFENREQARDFLEAKARETAQLAAAA
jgi:hypothetical protein